MDSILEEKIWAGGAVADIAKRLHGQVAVASAKVAYEIDKEIFGITGSRDWQTKERTGNGYCGPARAIKIQLTVIPST
jgi:hypothetical protein